MERRDRLEASAAATITRGNAIAAESANTPEVTPSVVDVGRQTSRPARYRRGRVGYPGGAALDIAAS